MLPARARSLLVVWVLTMTLACVERSAGDAPVPSTQCSGGQMAVYTQPGCAQAPVCAPPPPACAQMICGCDGEPVNGCNDVAFRPFKHLGACTPADKQVSGR